MANGMYYRRRSIAGPVILIGLGVLFLLANIGALSKAQLWWWFSTYWPLLLIVLGIVRLAEYIIARNSGGPTPRFGGGSIFLLILFIFIGIGATQSRRVNWPAVRDNMGVDADFSPFFGQKYDFEEQQVQEAGKAKSLQIDNEHGSVKIHPQDERTIKLVVHRHIGAESQDEANKVNSAGKTTFTLEGDTWRIQPSRPEARVHVGFYAGPTVANDLEIWAPRDLVLNVSNSHGDIAVENRAGDVTLTTTHGDIQAQDIKGKASLTTHHGSIRASNITGDVTVNGRLDDTSISQVSGSVTLEGDFFGETRLTKIAKAVHFTSSRTEMQLAKLDGDFQMNPGDLRATSLAGPFTLRTRSTDVHLENVSGDVRIENTHAEVEVHPATPAGNVEVLNRQGAIHLVLPSNAAFTVDARSNHGDIETDFELAKEESGHQTSATGNIGKGGPRLQLSTDHGVIEIRKG
ncbi:MAG TPA: DUF4097 family beta strand repeat-containing protein [Terriglobales bacterium]